MQSLKVNEIFYSLQGEGARVGEPSIFVRLTGCSAKNSCMKSEVVCDTEFESGRDCEVEALRDYIEYNNNSKCKWIIWTGGEPTDQLTTDIVEYFKGYGYKQAVECSGIKQPPEMDWVVLSPKVAEHIILKKWEKRNGFHCDELRWVRHGGQAIPETKIKAKKYYISPHSDGLNINDNNLQHCIGLCMENPEWNLSVQQHKLWQVL